MIQLAGVDSFITEYLNQPDDESGNRTVGEEAPEYTINKLFGAMKPTYDESKEMVASAAKALAEAENVKKSIKNATDDVTEAKTRAEDAALAAERALPHILTVLSILLAAVIAIMCVYLTSIFENIAELERVLRPSSVQPDAYISYRQHSFSQLLLLGHVAFNIVWFFVYLCAKLIDRVKWLKKLDGTRVEDDRAPFFTSGFIGIVFWINVCFVIAYIVLRVFRNSIFG